MELKSLRPSNMVSTSTQNRMLVIRDLQIPFVSRLWFRGWWSIQNFYFQHWAKTFLICARIQSIRKYGFWSVAISTPGAPVDECMCTSAWSPNSVREGPTRPSTVLTPRHVHPQNIYIHTYRHEMGPMVWSSNSTSGGAAAADAAGRLSLVARTELRENIFIESLERRSREGAAGKRGKA